MQEQEFDLQGILQWTKQKNAITFYRTFRMDLNQLCFLSIIDIDLLFPNVILNVRALHTLGNVPTFVFS